MPAQNFDVICGRGRFSYNHEGNRRFRSILEAHMDRYAEAKCRLDKSLIVSDICKQIRKKGEFVRQDGDEWVAVPERLAREKCGQGLRDVLHGQYKSSTQAKQARRKVDLKHQTVAMTKLVRSNQRVCAVIDNMEVDEDMSDEKAMKLFNDANIAILNELKLCDMHLSAEGSGISIFDTVPLPIFPISADFFSPNLTRVVSDEAQVEAFHSSMDFIDSFENESLTSMLCQAVEMI